VAGAATQPAGIRRPSSGPRHSIPRPPLSRESPPMRTRPACCGSTVGADPRPICPVLSAYVRQSFSRQNLGSTGPEPNLALALQAADGGRTRDLKLGKLALYQLSYRRMALQGAGEVCPISSTTSPGARSSMSRRPEALAAAHAAAAFISANEPAIPPASAAALTSTLIFSPATITVMTLPKRRRRTLI
jgi:hypothetical protein